MDILLKGATVITQNTKREIVKGDVLIQDGRIADVAAGIREKAEKIIDASGSLLMPGLVNMHTHVAMTLFRGLGENLPLHRWLQEKIWPLEAKETAEDAYHAARLAIVEMLKSGTTAFAEMCLLGANEIANAATELGVRAHISQGLFDLLPGRTFDTELKTMVSGMHTASGLVQYGVGPHSPYTCSEQLLSAAADFAAKKKARIHLHVSETRKEVLDILKNRGAPPYEYLDRLGIITGRTILAHGGWVSKKEIILAGRCMATVVQTPFSELKLATGSICPLVEYDKARANVCLGTDGAASSNSLNMFGEIRLASALQKHKYWKVDALSAQRFLDFATINGAKGLGINSGSIETGKAADLIVLSNGANMSPRNDIVANIVYAAEPSNVQHVIINGRLVMEGRRLLTAEEDDIIAKAEWQAAEIRKR